MKKSIKILLTVGIVILSLLIVISLVGMVVSLCTKCDYLDVSSSVFVAATSSVLTIVALILTVESSNKLLAMEPRRDLNELCGSLSLENITINELLQPKATTHKNKLAQESNNNMRIVLQFKADKIGTLKSIAVEEFRLKFLYHNFNKKDEKSLYIRLMNDKDSLMSFQSRNGDEFYCEMITNVNEEEYKNFNDAMRNPDKKKIGLRIKLALKNICDDICEWDRSKENNSLCFQFANYDKDRQEYNFEKIAG